MSPWSLSALGDPSGRRSGGRHSVVPQKNGPLPQKYKELILIAINAATTHLYAPGVRRHTQNALKAGATPEEILEAIQLTTVMGMHSCNLAIPILIEEVEKMKESQPADE
jgi:alkylhydroperoxidase/carboxymuconolactone decarboxylase family protein YurZ